MRKTLLRRAILTMMLMLCLLPTLALGDDDSVQIQLAFVDENGAEIGDWAYAYMAGQLVDNGSLTRFYELAAGDYTITNFTVVPGYAAPADVFIRVNGDGSIKSLSSHASEALDANGKWIITIKLKRATYDVRMRLAFVDEDGNEIGDTVYGYLAGSAVDNKYSKVVPKLYAGEYEITNFVGLPVYKTPDDVVIRILDGSVECLSSHASAAQDDHGTWVITIELTRKTGGIMPGGEEELERFTVTFMDGDKPWEQTKCMVGYPLAIAGMPVPDAPEGYVFAGWYTKDGVHVQHGMTVERDIIAYAKWLALPKTGDPSSLMSWMLLLGASGFGMNALKRRKN